MGRATAAAAGVLGLFVLAACSSGHKSAPPSTTSTGSSTTTTAPTTTSTASSTTTAATLPATSTTGPSNRVAISDFTVSPHSPISCNSPTMVELKWSASGATSVVLSIDGSQFATYTGGAQDHLEPFACDGRPHAYLLTAHAGTATATATQVVTSTSG